MTDEILKGIGIGLAGLLVTGLILWWRKYQSDKAKARAFDIEIAENETKAKVEALSPDDLIKEINSWSKKE